jgi:hypothetical protein
VDGNDTEFRINLCKRRSNHTYSITGLVPSATVSKPWGVAIAGSTCSGDAIRIGEAWLGKDC